METDSAAGRRGAIIITGASRGIGAATALRAGAIGYSVCVNYRRNKSAADRVVAEILGTGARAVAVEADVGVEAAVLRMFDEAEMALGRISGLVNNAAVLERQTRVDEISAERLERVLRTNVMGPFLCAREAVRRLSTKFGGSGGAIVNVSSVAARLGAPGEYVDYAASKGAVDALTIGLAREVASEGIRVNGVRPAFINTEIHASGGDPDRIGRASELIPMRRNGRPEEVAEAILWLLSDAASFTTGSFIEVSGGK